MQTAQQSTLNKHSHFHMAVFLTLCVLLDTAIKGLLLQASWGLLPEWMLGGTVYINVWNRHLVPIPITTIPTPTVESESESSFDSDSRVGIAPGLPKAIAVLTKNLLTNYCTHLDLNCRHFDLSPFWFSPFWLVPGMTSIQLADYPYAAVWLATSDKGHTCVSARPTFSLAKLAKLKIFF